LRVCDNTSSIYIFFKLWREKRWKKEIKERERKREKEEKVV
jgi:hypothetical protein